MILVTARVEIDPARVAALKGAIAAMESASRAESGCIDYVFTTEINDPSVVRIVERWHSMGHRAERDDERAAAGLWSERSERPAALKRAPDQRARDGYLGNRSNDSRSLTRAARCGKTLPSRGQSAHRRHLDSFSIRGRRAR